MKIISRTTKIHEELEPHEALAAMLSAFSIPENATNVRIWVELPPGQSYFAGEAVPLDTIHASWEIKE